MAGHSRLMLCCSEAPSGWRYDQKARSAHSHALACLACCCQLWLQIRQCPACNRLPGSSGDQVCRCVQGGKAKVLARVAPLICCAPAICSPMNRAPAHLSPRSRRASAVLYERRHMSISEEWTIVEASKLKVGPIYACSKMQLCSNARLHACILSTCIQQASNSPRFSK